MSRADANVGLWNNTNNTYGLAQPLYNYLDNGGFVVQQRRPGAVTSLLANASAQVKYAQDRWQLRLPAGAGTGMVTYSLTDLSNTPNQYIDTSYPELEAYIALVNNTATLVSNTRIQQEIPNVKTLSGKWVTLSAWVYTPTAVQNVGLQIVQNFGSGGSPSPSVSYSNTSTIAAINRWQLVTLTTQLGLTSSKTLGTNGDSSLAISIVPDNSLLFYVLIAMVQLEEGQVYTGFHRKDPDEELFVCKRYYQKSFAPTSAPGDGSDLGRQFVPYAAPLYGTIVFPVEMNKAPAMFFYRPGGGTTAGQAYNWARGNQSSALTATVNTNSKQIEWTMTAGAGWAPGDLIGFQWEAKADFSDPA